MEPELDDTVIKPLRPLHYEYPLDDGDTLVRARRAPQGERRGTAGSQQVVTRAEYAFVVNTHPPIGLERPAFIGRRPSVPRIGTGDRPRLVRVPSPLGEVSGTHLELRHVGASITATDLRSTNGTTVRLPGTAPIRLRQGESVVVTPGTLIEIGDGNVIEIQSVRHAHPSETGPGGAEA